MKKKLLLLPVAALALAGTNTYAYNTDLLEDAGLNDSQIETFAEAHELKKAGERDEARDVLIDAGIDLDTLKEIRQAHKEHRALRREAVRTALEAEDFDAYRDAVADSRVSDIVTTEADFARLVEAYELRQSGERAEARAIMEDLGFQRPDKSHKRGG